MGSLFSGLMFGDRAGYISRRNRNRTVYDPNQPDDFQSYDAQAMEPGPAEQRLSETAGQEPPAFREPPLSKRREILGSLATVFGGRGGLGRLGARTLYEPVEKAERAYRSERLNREDTLKGQGIAAGIERGQQAARYRVFAGERKAQLEDPYFRARTENQLSQVGKNEAQEAAFLRPKTQRFISGKKVMGISDIDPTHPFELGEAPTPPERQFGPRAVNPGQGIYEGGRMRIAPNADVFNRARKTAGGGAKSEAQRRIFETQHITRTNAIQKIFDDRKAKLKDRFNRGFQPYEEIKAADQALEQERTKYLDQENKDYGELKQTLGYADPEEADAQGAEAEDRDSEEGETSASEGDIVENTDGQMFTVRGGKLVPYGR